MLVRPALNLFLVADGMGGHNAGEVASALAALSLENCFAAGAKAPLPAELIDDPRDLGPDARRLLAAVRKANADVHEIACTHAEHKGMGTTVVAACFTPETGEFHVAHVGDSRCYRLRGGILEQLTQDHSLIGEALAQMPDLTPEQLAMLPKNVISRALGRGPTVQVDVRTEAVEAGDAYLLCSDGLSGVVTDEALARMVDSSADVESICGALIEAARDGGAPDNVSAIVVRIERAL